LAPPAYAQTEALAPGREVRLFVRGVIAPFEGTLTSARPDALTLTLLDGSEFTISPAQLQRSEVLSSRTNARWGAMAGGGIGLGIGVFLVIQARNDCDRDAYGVCDEFGTHFDEWRLVIPSVAGIAAGALVGHFIRSPTWVPGFVSGASDGAGLGLAWAIPVGYHP
jgi:hypothetical protein